MKPCLIMMFLVIGHAAAQHCRTITVCDTTTTSTTSTTTTTPGPLACGEHTITPGEIYPIESPNYPDKYGETDSCKWELTCDENAGVIGISCEDFKTEEDTDCKDADFLKVTDSTGTIDYFCGKTGPDLESADNYLELKFNTDEDSTVKRGFSCSVVCIVKTTTTSTSITSTAVTVVKTTTTTTTPKPTTITPTPIPTTSATTTTTTSVTTTTTPGPLGCGEHTLTPGEIYPIESPNYPDKYGETDSCKWELTCDANAGVIAISCEDFKTEEDTKCKNADFLKVTDSTGTIDYFCGTSGPDLESADNYLELKFSTDDDSTVKRGFSCSVVCAIKTTSTTTTTTPKPTTITPTQTTSTTTTATTTPGPLACGEHTLTPGEDYPIESPNYPDNYGKTDSCKWELTCDENAGVIAISCEDFKTESAKKCKKADFLKVTDSTGTIDWFCGTSGPDLESADNYLKLNFGTDDDNTVKRGFSCSVKCKVKTTTTVKPSTTTIGPLDCGEHTLRAGEIYPIISPNYPNQYGEDDDCKWEFTCDSNAGVIGISCDDFKTEEADPCEDGDYLKLTDNTGTIDYYCGKDGPDVESVDNYLKVKFGTNDDSIVKRGFSCSVVCRIITTTTTTTTTTPKPTTTTSTTPKPTTAPTTTDTTTTTTDTTVDPDKTTTPSGGWSGNCSKTITAYAGMTEYWVSPKYNGSTHYPKGEYCCSLNITIPDTYDMFMVNMEMESPSSIYETSQCVHDNIMYHSADGHESTLCGDLSGNHWTQIASYNTPLYFYFTWCSTNLDGHTDIGFKMEVTGKDLSTG